MFENEFRVSALTEDDVIGRIYASKQEKGQIDINQYIGHDQPYFINTLMRHYAEKNASSDTALNEAIANKVTQFVRDICGQLQNTMFAGKITPCGSVAEGTKVGDFDEFDFIYEISDMSLCSNELLATNILPETFRSKKRNVTSGEKSFFTLHFRNEVSDEWQQFMKCKECDSPESCSPEHEGRFIHSQSVQAAFMEAIRSNIPGIEDISQELRQSNTSINQSTHNYETYVHCSSEHEPLLSQIAVTRYDGTRTSSTSTNEHADSIKAEKNGPAATIYLTTTDPKAPAMIKVDVTLAIKVSCSILQQSGLLLRSLPEDEEPVDVCHLVCTGDHWRVSFVQQETHRMKQLMMNSTKSKCFRALKSLRDELSVTGKYDPTLFPTYPLKVSFLKEQVDNDEPWHSGTIGSHAVSTLGRIVEEGLEGGQTSYYIQDDLLNPGKSNRSFWEAMRMLRNIEQSVKLYGRQGRVHTGVMVLFYVLNVTLIIADLFEYNDSMRGNNVLNANALLGLSNITISPFMVGLGIFGIIWVFVNDTLILHIFRPILILYVFMILSSLILLSFGIFLLAENRSYTPPTNPPIILRRVAYCSPILAGLNICVITTHVVIVAVCGHERCRRYSYPDRGMCFRHYFCCEVVFFSEIYRNIRCYCCNRRDNILEV